MSERAEPPKPTQLRDRMKALGRELREVPLEPRRQPPDPPDMDGRVTRLEEWSKQSEARTARIEEKLDRIIERLAAMPTREAFFGWGLGLIATVIATGIAGVASVASMQANTLAAFQAGLAAVQSSASSQASQPIVIQVPPQPQPPPLSPEAPRPQ